MFSGCVARFRKRSLWFNVSKVLRQTRAFLEHIITARLTQNTDVAPSRLCTSVSFELLTNEFSKDLCLLYDRNKLNALAFHVLYIVLSLMQETIQCA